MRKVSAGGKNLLIARVGASYYCVDSVCTHMGGDLSKGILKGKVIECPLHHTQFDLSDGHVIRWTDGAMSVLFRAISKPMPLMTYPVKVDGDQVLVMVP